MVKLNFCQSHPNSCTERINIYGINPYNTLRQSNIFPDSYKIEKGYFRKDYFLEKSRSKTLGENAYSITKQVLPKLLSKAHLRVAKVSKGIPEELNDYVKMIQKNSTLPNGYEDLFEGDKFKVVGNAEEGKLRITFEGAGEKDFHNVKNVILNKPLEGKDIKQEEAFLDELFKNGTKEVEIDGVKYNDIKFIGHSLGGYKARKYGAEYNIDSELLNAHIMPWNKFKDTTAHTNMHTIITDPVDMKFLIQPKDNLTHTYYMPPTQEEMTFSHTFVGEPIPEEGMAGSISRAKEPHYLTAWNDLDRDEQATIAETLKTQYPELFSNTALGALTIAGSIYQAHTDPNYDPKYDPMLGSASETGVIGLNLDPNYQWSDRAPPSSGLDWLIWKSLSPIAKDIASESNPEQAQSADTRIEQAGHSTLSSELYTFKYQGEEYYYQKDENGNPIWFSEGEPLSQDIKDAYNQQVSYDMQSETNKQEAEAEAEDTDISGFNLMPF